MQTLRSIRLTVAIVMFVAFFTLPNLASAVEYGGLGGRPANPHEDNPRSESIFIYELDAGGAIGDSVLVINNTSETKQVWVYAADSTPSTDGAFACEQRLQEPDVVGSWIYIQEGVVELEAQSTKLVSFAVEVPDSLDPGEYNGCILIQEQKENVDGAGVNLSFRTGIRVAITVPGEIARDLDIVSFTAAAKNGGDHILTVEAQNSGTVSIDADVEVTTKHVLGFEEVHHGGTYPVLRDQSATWNFVLERPFWGGVYKSTALISYDDSENAGIGVESGEPLEVLTGETIWFFSIPSIGALLIYLAIIVAIALFVVWAKKRSGIWKWVREDWVKLRTKSSDSLEKIAKSRNVDWKLVAKVNKLKPPYDLTKKTILVPPKRRKKRKKKRS